ncbi:hypothetical protein B0H12DRAFT_1126108 [Mycena haematopus]|nr:hypothetical protein B0H12DRAFT_1126108 [Mycena haematopus]
MAPRFTAAQRQSMQALAEQIFGWELLVEEHAAILRADPNQYATVYEAYVDNAPPIAFLPPRDDWQSSIKDCKDILTRLQGCTSFSDRLMVVNACSYLCRIHLIISSEEDYKAYLEMQRIKSSLQNAYYSQPQFQQRFLSPTPVPSDPHPLLVRELGLGVSALTTAITPAVPSFPTEMPAASFSFDSLADLPRIPVTADDIAQYRQNPDSLLHSVFVCNSEDSEDGPEAFQVSSMLTTQTAGRLFYIVFADEGPSAVCHSAVDFFPLLSSSYRIDSYTL